MMGCKFARDCHSSPAELPYQPQYTYLSGCEFVYSAAGGIFVPHVQAGDICQPETVYGEGFNPYGDRVETFTATAPVGLLALRGAYLPVSTGDFIAPGKPVENAFVESFNGKFRDECLNQHWFLDLADARQTIEAWRQHYNQHRPHSALRYQTPDAVAAQAVGTLTITGPKMGGTSGGFPPSQLPPPWGFNSPKHQGKI